MNISLTIWSWIDKEQTDTVALLVHSNEFICWLKQVSGLYFLFSALMDTNCNYQFITTGPAWDGGKRLAFVDIDL